MRHGRGRAGPSSRMIDVDAHDFLAPGDMPARIREYCRRTGQTVPEGVGPIARVVYESLALKYRRVLEMMETLVGHRIGVLHIVGGGAQNRLLNQLTADAIGRPVVAGPVRGHRRRQPADATARHRRGRLAGRGPRARPPLVRHRDVFEPEDAAAWDEAYARFRSLTG